MSKLIPKHQTPSQPLVLSQDNTRVDKLIESIPITETNLYKQYLADPYKNSDFNTWKKRQELIQSSRKDEKVKADKRSSRVKEQETKQGEAIHSQQERKKREAAANKVIWTGIGLGGLALAQATPAAPYIDAAFATHGALGLAKQYEEGTLGLNLETGLHALEMLPFGVRGVKYVDNVAREAYAPYDFYRTIQETTPVVKQPIQTEILVNPIKHTQKGSMELFQRKSTNTQNTWVKPFQNNMGILDFKTFTISGNQFGKLIGEGSEQAVYLHPTDPTKVLKVYYDIDYPTLKDLRKGVNSYQKRNNVPFQLETRFKGYVTDKTGQLHPVFSQQKVESTVPRGSQNWVNNISPRLDKQMEKVGYSNSHGNYIRGTRKIIDVNPANITELPNGEFRFIDAFPEGFKTGGKISNT